MSVPDGAAAGRTIQSEPATNVLAVEGVSELALNTIAGIEQVGTGSQIG